MKKKGIALIGLILTLIIIIVLLSLTGGIAETIKSTTEKARCQYGIFSQKGCDIETFRIALENPDNDDKILSLGISDKIEKRYEIWFGEDTAYKYQDTLTYFNNLYNSKDKEIIKQEMQLDSIIADKLFECSRMYVPFSRWYSLISCDGGEAAGSLVEKAIQTGTGCTIDKHLPIFCKLCNRIIFDPELVQAFPEKVTSLHEYMTNTPAPHTKLSYYEKVVPENERGLFEENFDFFVTPIGNEESSYAVIKMIVPMQIVPRGYEWFTIDWGFKEILTTAISSAPKEGDVVLTRFIPYTDVNKFCDYVE